MEIVNELCDLLQSHGNRDKIIVVVCVILFGFFSFVVALASYVLKLWGASADRKPLLLASGRLAAARASLRLFDDAAAVKAFLNYGTGKQDGFPWGPLGVANGALTLAYLQVEKAVWLMDTSVLQLPKDIDYRIRTAHKLLWSLSAFVGLIRSIRALHLSSHTLKSPDAPRCAGARFTLASLMTTKLILDVIHAVSWLPPGWLWGGRIEARKVSRVATASAVIALYAHFFGKALARSK